MATIDKRGESYRITVSAGYDINDKQIRKTMTWKPSQNMTAKQIEKELDRQKTLFEDRVASGRVLDGNIKFADYADYWMNEYAVKQLRATTIAGYKNMFPRIKESIGHLKLEQIRPNHLMQFYSELTESGVRNGKKCTPLPTVKSLIQESGYTQTSLAQRAGISVRVLNSVYTGKNITYDSAEKIALALNTPIDKLFEKNETDEQPLSSKTVLHHHRLISTMLEKAVKWQIIFDNPCTRVEVPKVERKEARYLDEKQAAQLLEHLTNAPLQYRTIITLLLYSGMRRGEVLGLEWSDIDFNNNVIDINKSSLYRKDHGIFNDDTKNASSRRIIKLPYEVMELLVEHKKSQTAQHFKLGDQWINSNKLFCKWDGSPIHPDTVTSWFHDFVLKNNLPAACIHSLRHTNATLLIASGVDLRTVSKRLGHSQMSTTGNIYTHAIQTADERAADTLADILSPGSIKNKKAAE